jgi:hypothetical protein
MNVPGVASNPVRVNVPVPKTSSDGFPPGLEKENVSEDTISDVVLVGPVSLAVYNVKGVAVDDVKLVIVTQPVHVLSSVKLPLTAPILAGLTNVTDVAVKVSDPFSDIVEPAAIGTALA